MKINGRLDFDASSASEIRNMRIEKVAELPPYVAADAGRLVYVTGANTIYYGHSGQQAWVAIATGGNAAALQTEVDAIEASLGAGINANGTFAPGGFGGAAYISSPTSFTDAIMQLDAAINGNNTLAELDDVALTGAVGGDFLRYNGTAWTDSTIDLSTDLGITVTAATINQLGAAVFNEADLNKLHAVTASAAELNILDGATLSTTELNYLVGVTSPIQTQLDGKQAVDPTLTG